MHLPEAYRSLPRPSSSPKPSHPPDSVVYQPGEPQSPVGVRGLCTASLHYSLRSLLTLHPQPFGRELHLILGRKTIPEDSSFLSKEVIRPQVPLRPPCYDFTLLTKLRFDAANFRPHLTQTSFGWCDGQCVQGAGTYSPRADNAQLLGIPCSRGRVTALDPN